MSEKRSNISLAGVQRMPNYLRYLKTLESEGKRYTSSVAIAEFMGMNPIVVKKDLSMALTFEGKPKLGYDIKALIADIESFLGYDNMKDAVLVGVGKLGSALLSYDGFNNYGINICAGFDIDDRIVGKEVSGKYVLHIGKMQDLITRMNVHIGIIAVPKERAQLVADLMVSSGIKAIWNFAPVHLNLPDNVVVKNEDIASSLAILINKLKDLTGKQD